MILHAFFLKERYCWLEGSQVDDIVPQLLVVDRDGQCLKVLADRRLRLLPVTFIFKDLFKL